MATKNVKRQKQASDDSVLYKVPAAFALLCIVLYGLHKFGAYYQTLAGFSVFLEQMPLIGIAFVVLAVILGGVAFLCHVKWVNTVARYLCVLAVLAGVSAFIFMQWTTYLYIVYFIHIYVYCLYMIWELYHAEFFAFSLINVLFGYAFYECSKGMTFCLRVIVPLALAIAAAAVICSAARLSSQNNGKVKLGKKSVHVFPAAFNPVLLYSVSVVLLVCFLLSLLLGQGFAYYCMFAAIAFELIAAVYYTFQLK